jgi:hypothetical protein
VAGCTNTNKPETFRDRYDNDPGMYYGIMLILYDKNQRDVMYKRFVLIDPNYISSESKQ